MEMAESSVKTSILLLLDERDDVGDGKEGTLLPVKNEEDDDEDDTVTLMLEPRSLL